MIISQELAKEISKEFKGSPLYTIERDLKLKEQLRVYRQNSGFVATVLNTSLHWTVENHLEPIKRVDGITCKKVEHYTYPGEISFNGILNINYVIEYIECVKDGLDVIFIHYYKPSSKKAQSSRSFKNSDTKSAKQYLDELKKKVEQAFADDISNTQLNNQNIKTKLERYVDGDFTPLLSEK